MPNWVTNKVTIKSLTKETMDKFLKAGKPNKKEDRIEGHKYSFGSWRPMPRTFRQYDTTNHPNGEGLVIGDPLDYFVENSPIVTEKLIEKFKKATAHQEKKYGVVGWYDWKCKFYGCKWDAGFDIEHISDTEVQLSIFDTAWSAPLEFFEFIAQKFGLVIDMLSHYEDCENRHIIINDEFDGGEYYGDCDYTEMREEFLRRVDEDDTLSDEQKTIRKATVDRYFVDDYWFCSTPVDENWDNFNDWFVECIEQEDEEEPDESEEK